jgi:hypothetical protein
MASFRNRLPTKKWWTAVTGHACSSVRELHEGIGQSAVTNGRDVLAAGGSARRRDYISYLPMSSGVRFSSHFFSSSSDHSR